ncbi:MAG: CHAT domain-containing protein [Limnothrix sp. RL_2_0]|nr:CHAT domain-containing protein [Limnothrix sp. RL_2_0]
MNHIQSKLLLVSTINLAIALLSMPVSAGEIVPSGETNTFVNQNGNLFEINGGESSLDGQNLFHTFSDFNLYLNEIADFNTNQNLINLLVGVNGGNPSFIDGLIRLTGSNANFFFINPSGIAFGQNASIDLPADLYLSTANRIGFSSGQVFDVLGENNYQDLGGDPNAFIFDASQASGIINEGNLGLQNGGDLSIIANGIIHTGTIDAGNVIIQSIPGSSKVKLTPKGSFVSYEIELPRDESGNLKSFTLYEIASLLEEQGESNLNLENEKITFLNHAVENNDLIAKDIKANSLYINSPDNIALIGGRVEIQNEANIISQETLYIRENPDNLFSIRTGGNLTLQGNSSVDILALDDLSETPIVSGGSLNLISDGIVSIDSHFLSNGNINFWNLQNKPATLTSLYDPIISANGNVEFAGYTGAALKVEATGSIFINGNVDILFPDDSPSLPDDPPFGSDLYLLQNERAIIFRAGLSNLENPTNIPRTELGGRSGLIPFDFVGTSQTNGFPNGSLVIDGSLDTTSQGNITPSFNFFGGPIILETQGQGDISINGNLRANFSERVDINAIDVGDAGDVAINSAGGVTISGVLEAFSNADTSGDGATINITANNDIQINNNIRTDGAIAQGGTGSAGDINITSNNGSISILGDVFAQGDTSNGIGGRISFNASNGNLTVGDITSAGVNSGDITLIATGNISAGTLLSNPNLGNSGSVILNAGYDLTLTGTDNSASVFNGVVSAFSSTNSSGTVDLTAGGNINLNCPYNCLRVGADPNNAALTAADAGSISLNAGGGINLQNIFTGDTSGFMDSLPLFLDASNPLGDGGQISLRAVNDIQVGTMSVSSFGVGSNAGRIDIFSEMGSVDTTIPALGDSVLAGRTLGTNTESAQSNGGFLSIEADGDITTGFLRFFGTQNGGAIELISNSGGTIDTTAGNLEIFSQENASAGSATLSTTGIINLGAINDIEQINPLGDTNIRTISNANGANLTLNASTTNLFRDIDVSGNSSGGSLIAQSNVTLHDSVSITGDNFSFSGNLDSLDGNQSLTLNAGGNISFLNAIGTSNPLAGLNITSNQVDISQNMTVNGDINFNALANIQADSVINAGSNNIALNNGLTANGGVTLEADTLDLLGLFTGNGNILNIRPASLGENITVGSEVANTLSISDTELALFDGFRQVSVGRNDGTGNISITNDITFQDPLLLQTGTGSIIVDGNATGIDDASISLNAPTTFLNADITTNNQGITINGNTNLGANVNVDTGAGAGNIAFNGSITGANQTLNTRSGLGETTLGDLVLVFDINIDTASNVNLGGNLTITAPNEELTLNNSTTLTNDVDITTAGGNITTNNTINSQLGTNFDLGINPAGGDFTNNGTIGGTQALGNVVINNAQNVESNAPTEVLSFTINNAQNVALNDDLTANGSNVNITANGDISTTNITSNGGGINLVSDTGNVSTGNLNSSNAAGRGGDISIISLRNSNSTITTNNINSSGNIGGNINLQAIKTITTNEIFARGTVGNGGNVTIDPVNVVVNFIDAQGGAFGTGGNVDITATEFFRATGGFVDDTGLFSSISTFGGAGSGSITIRHDGGDLFVPFIVGDASINGTAGALNSGDFTIAPFQVFPGPYYLGNISIITGDRFQNALTQATNIRIPELEPAVELEETGFFIDEFFTRTYERYFENNLLAEDIRIKSLSEIKDELKAVEDATGIKPALIYALFQPQAIPAACKVFGLDEPKIEGEIIKGELKLNEQESCVKNPLTLKERDDDVLTLITVTSDQPAKVAIVPSATRVKITAIAQEFTRQSTQPQSLKTRGLLYYQLAQDLHKWLVQPLENELQAGEESDDGQEKINNLTFIADGSLRTIPFAALVDPLESDQLCLEGNPNACSFLIEEYSAGLMPSMSLTDTQYQKLTESSIRLGGAVRIEGQTPLLMLEDQLQTLEKIWTTGSENKMFNQDFIIQGLISKQKDQEYGIIHLATHAKFTTSKQSYIAFVQEDLSSSGELIKSELKLQGVRSLELNNVNLLTLNACETAIGDESAELGFAGFAHKAGAKSVLGSLWKVQEDATNILMLNFYSEFINSSSQENLDLQSENKTKAESLRQVQLNLLQGRTKIDRENGQLIFNPALNAEQSYTLDVSEYCTKYHCQETFVDPYYWSGFTLIGNPW